ncbi:MAG: nuclease-related domain-containing protein [Acidimicrobiales bacterium]
MADITPHRHGAGMPRCNQQLPTGGRCQRKRARGRDTCGIDHANPKARTYGRAGGSLGHMAGQYGGKGIWGQKGERATAQILAKALGSDPDVVILHDLSIPGFDANVDHVVVKGNRVFILDSKVWKPGFYWRFGHRCMRGWKSFPPAGKKTVGMAVDRYRAALTQAKVPVQVTGLLVVHPSKAGAKLSTGWLRSPNGVGIHVVGPDTGARLARMVGKGQAQTDERLVSWLASLARAA